MANTGPAPLPIHLTRHQQARLREIVDRDDSRVAIRARIVLAAAEGLSNVAVADRVGVSPNTVSSWRRRFHEGGVDALADASRSPRAGMRAGRPPMPVSVDDDQRAVLERWCRRTTTAAGLAQRARIVLAAADGQSNTEIASLVGCHSATVTKWRKRFAANGLAGLSDEYRSGRKRTITDDQVEDVIVRTIGPPRLMGDAVVGAGHVGPRRPVTVHHWSDLAGVRASTASPPEVQTLNRPELRGQAP